MMVKNSCSFIANNEIGDEDLFFTAQKLRVEISKAIQDGYTNFISNFDNVPDLIFADLVLETIKANENITLEAAISNSYKLENKDYFFNRLINRCNTVGVTSLGKEDCTIKRNKLMIDFSQRVILFSSSAKYLIDYAKRFDKNIVII